MQVNHYGHTLNFLMRTTAKHIGVVHFVFAKSINVWNKNHSNWLYNCVTFRNGAPFTDAKTSSTKNYMAVPNWVHPTTTTPTKTAEIDIFFSQIEIDLTTPITLPINSQIHTHSECMLHANSHFLFFSMCSKSQSQAVCVCNSQIEKITIHSIYLIHSLYRKWWREKVTMRYNLIAPVYFYSISVPCERNCLPDQSKNPTNSETCVNQPQN